jgi:acyl carrier protein
MPTPEELIPQLKELIVERLFLSVSAADLKEDASLMDEYNADSISLMEIVVGLEEEMGVVVDDDEFDIEIFTSVRSIAEFASGKLNG